MTSAALNPEPGENSPVRSAALEGIRVVDFTRVLAGPFATQTLGDLGAQIIKIEHPQEPDFFRIRQPQFRGEGTSFLSLNRNKQSVVLDLANPLHRDAALDLIRTADVLVENYTTRVMRKYGLDYSSIAAENPRLIYCSISAYGRTGSRADAPGYDGIAAAEAGVTWMMSTPEGDHQLAMGGVPMIDITTAMNATSAILAALFARERLGVGQALDISLYDTAITNLSYHGYQYLAIGKEPERFTRHAPLGGPAGYYQTTDGPLIMVVNNDRDFQKLCNAIERPDLAADPKLTSYAARQTNLAWMNASIQDTLLTQSRAYWMERLQMAKIPSGPVSSVGEALSSRFVTERQLLSEIEHPGAGMIPNIASPLRMSLTPPETRSPPPILGEHTEQVLRDILGYSDEQVARIYPGKSALQA